MIDIHAHILPGIDDGARDIRDTVEMLRMAADNGIHTIIATPHCNLPGRYDNYFGEEYIHAYERAVKAAKAENIDIQICPGMEAFATFDLPELIIEKKIMPLNQSSYILVEFAVDEDPDFADDLLKRMSEIGANPVVAHAERYEFVQDNPKIANNWQECGYQIQCNKASFLGKFGRNAKKTAFYMLDHHLASVIASDAHSIRYRRPDMTEAYAVLRERYSETYLQLLFEENPRRICENQPTLRYQFTPI